MRSRDGCRVKQMIVDASTPVVLEALESRRMLAAPVVGLSLTNPIDAASSGKPLQFVVTRNVTTTALNVSYRVGGSATQANYSQHLTGTASFAVGQALITLNVTPLVSTTVQSNKTVTIQLLNPNDSSYTLATNQQSTGLIQENEGTTYHDLYVGPGQTYSKVSQALAAAKDGYFIDVLTTGNYANDTSLVSHNNITIRGIGNGRAAMPWTQPTTSIPNQKGILVFQTGYNNLTVENMYLTGAWITASLGGNAAGIRAQGTGLVVNNCYFGNDQMGLLGGLGVVTIQYSEFVANGAGDGLSHNVYIGVGATTFTFKYNYSHDASVGHTLKSRALVNIIEYNRFADESSNASYEVSTPNGGQDYIVGNIIEQGPNSQNAVIIDYGSETNPNPPKSTDFLYVINNTIVNNKSVGTFIRAMNLPAAFNLTAKNNIFAGPGTAITMLPKTAGTAETPVTSNNLITTVAAAGFVSPSTFNYHLLATSPAINKGVSPGTGNGMSLTPTGEYASPASGIARPINGTIDIGGYEYMAGPQGAPYATIAAVPAVSTPSLKRDDSLFSTTAIL